MVPVRRDVLEMKTTMNNKIKEEKRISPLLILPRVPEKLHYTHVLLRHITERAPESIQRKMLFLIFPINFEYHFLPRAAMK
jgi:hypothetical protein